MLIEGKRNQARTNGSDDSGECEGREGSGEERCARAFSRMKSRVSRRSSGFGRHDVRDWVSALFSQVGCWTRTLTAGGSVGVVAPWWENGMVRCKRRVCRLAGGVVSGGEMERSRVAEILGLDVMASWLFSASPLRRMERVDCAASERVRSSGYMARRRSIWPICSSSRSGGRRCQGESIVVIFLSSSDLQV